jgi:hypothetical protein
MNLNKSVDFATAQAQLRDSYVRGGPGAIVSGVVWLAAAVATSRSTITTGFAVLFFGGILIFPISLLLVRSIWGRSPPSRGNPGERAVVETVFPMIGGLFAAWLMLPYRPDWVFPLSALAVGAHYFGFRTAYGDATYWVLGAVMCLMGIAAVLLGLPGQASFACLIAATEVLFGAWLTWRGRSLAAPRRGKR